MTDSFDEFITNSIKTLVNLFDQVIKEFVRVIFNLDSDYNVCHILYLTNIVFALFNFSLYIQFSFYCCGFILCSDFSMSFCPHSRNN